MIKTQKINNVSISKIRLPKLDNKKVRGGDLIPLYSNTFICAKKNSGKTTVIFNVIRKCLDRDTVVDLFVSTIEKDRSWIQIVKYLRDRNIAVKVNTSVIGPNGEDLIRTIIDTPVPYEESDDESSEEEKLKYISIDNPEEETAPRRRKPTKLAQKRIIIMDDIGNELKFPSIDQLLKINRHLRCKVILSSQYLNDVSPQGRRQIDVWMLFNGCKKEKLLTVMRDCDTHLDFPLFEQVYKYCTAEKFCFMYIDCQSSTFRKNFNHKIVLD